MKKIIFALILLLGIPLSTQAALTPTSWLRDTVSNFVRPNIATDSLRIPSLTSCDTIDTNGSGDFVCGTDSGGSPGGSSTELQFNNGGSFGGIPRAVYDGDLHFETGRTRFENSVMDGLGFLFDTSNITATRTYFAPDEDGGTLVLDDGSGNAGECAEFISTHTIKSSGKPCVGSISLSSLTGTIMTYSAPDVITVDDNFYLQDESDPSKMAAFDVGSLSTGTTKVFSLPPISASLSTLVATGYTNAWDDGVKQTFNPNGTNAGFNFGAHTAAPSSLANGDAWYNSTSNVMQFRINGSTVNLSGTNTGDQTITLTGDVTGSGTGSFATTIGSDKVLESMLKVVDTPADEECLTYESTGGDFEWQTCGSGSGNVTKVGTPVDNQIGVWTGDGTIEGDTALTFDTTTDTVATTNLNLLTNLSFTKELNHIIKVSDSTTSNTDGGNLTIDTGAKTGSGEYGRFIVTRGGNTALFFTDSFSQIKTPPTGTDITLTNSTNNINATLALASIATSNKTFTLPNRSGTFSLSGDTFTGDVTGTLNSSGATALTIGSDKVLESMLKVVDTPADEECLTYEATGGDFEWQTCGSGSGTVTNTGGNLTANAVVLGAGTVDTKVSTGITTDGTAQLNLGVNATTIGKLKLFGNTSGDATIQPAAVAGTATVLTLPATTDTLIGKATTDTLTNKTYDTAGTGNSFSINGLAATANTGTGAVVRATSPTLTTPTLGAATYTTLSGGNITDSGLTSGRVTFASTGGLLVDDAGFLFNSTTDQLTLGENGQDGSFKIYAEDGATDHSTIFQPGTQTQDITYTLPVDDGTSGQFLTTDGGGVLSWTTSSGSGDITSVGDVASGAAFDGTQGTILTFNDADGDKTLEYDNTNNWFEFNARVSPASNDGAALGSTGQSWSDLFLAEGGVVNWDNGDATMTQTGDDVTFAGITSFGLGTSTALTLGTIEVGAASDTTISRNAAGQINIEGVQALTASNTVTVTNKTIASASNVLDACIPVAVTDEYSNLVAGTSKVTFRMPFAMTVTSVRGSLNTVATGGTLVTVDINESGTTILSTKLTFDASEKTTTTAATAAVISDSSLADDAEMTVDIDAVGNTTPGNGLKISICGTI